MNFGNILSIAGGALGLADAYNTGDYNEGLTSGAALVAGVAGATGHTNIQKIAGITALGSGAYGLFTGGSSAPSPVASAATADASSSGIADTLNPSRSALSADSTTVPTGPAQTGQSFSDAGYDQSNGMAQSWSPSADATITKTPVATAPTSLLSAANGVGSFINNNKELVKIGGTALDSMFGTQAQQTSLLKQKLALDQQAAARKVANANNIGQVRIPVSVA